MKRAGLSAAVVCAMLALGAFDARAAQEPRATAKTAPSKTAAARTPPSKAPASKADAAKPPPEKEPGRLQEAGERTGEIMTQPVRDVGLAKSEIPPPLVAAVEAPYSLKGIKTCRQISAAVQELNLVLGDDFAGGEPRKENRAGKLAEAGGKTVVNSLIPYRSLVREISGAAPAQRRREAAIDAGYARRGFLRGVHQTRKCRTSL